MIKPEDLMRLPQDKMREIEKAKPKSTREEMEKFLSRVIKNQEG